MNAEQYRKFYFGERQCKMTKETFMAMALEEAARAARIGEVPIGAVIVKDNLVIGRGHNTRESSECALGHAELNAIKEASKSIGDWRLTDCDIYVTIEPCPMCSGALYQSRIRTIYYGAQDLKAGACGGLFNLFEVDGLNHYCQIESGIMEEACREIVKTFFKRRRR